MHRPIKYAALVVMVVLVVVLGSVHHSEMQYCADCGATGSYSQWRILFVPIWSTRYAGLDNPLSQYMQAHGWPKVHSDWRYVDALDSNMVLGITGWYAGNHFRRLRVRDVDRDRLNETTELFPELPELIDRLVLKVPERMNDEEGLLQMMLIQFLNGTVEWQELEGNGMVTQFQEIVNGT